MNVAKDSSKKTIFLTESSLKTNLILASIVTLIGYFTYFHNYQNPPAWFWDENYYLPSAQKYLNHIFFIHEHPPLGQILIALGEKIFHPNADITQYINTNYAGGEMPKDISFVGYRFFPALLSWWTAPILFFVFLLLVNNSWIAGLLSSLYLFDNALIVHSRGAMLDSPLIFFFSVTLLFFLLTYHCKNKSLFFIYSSLFMGVCLALTATSKVTGLILVLLFPALFWRLLPELKKAIMALFLSGFGFLLTYVMVWQVHFSLVYIIDPSGPENGLYKASPAYQEILKEKKNTSLLSFPVMFRDALRYNKNYQQGVPRLNLCKPEENGSPPFFWPLGARSISYRWETPNQQVFRYLYLQANPVIWLCGLLGVLISTALIIISWFVPLKEPLKNKFLITVFLGLYWSYMVGMTLIGRVMYLYHYFPPLILSFGLFALALMELKTLGEVQLNLSRKKAISLLLTTLMIVSYQFYSPFTYYQLISDAQFKKRSIFPLWDLQCVHCSQENPLFTPLETPE